MQNKYEEYAVLDAQIRQLTHQKEVLRDQILDDLEEQKLDKVETAVGKFTVATLKTWTYTEKVTEMNEDLKAQKAEEENTGDATCEIKSSLRFTKANL